MKNLEWFKKRKIEEEQEQEKLSRNLDDLRQKREEIEEQINSAIDSGNYAAVDGLTAKESELDNRIRAAEKILERKKETFSISKEEICAACNAEMKKYQSDVSDLMGEAEKYRRLHFETLIKAGEIVQAANEKRRDYINLSAYPIDDNDFGSVHAGYDRHSFTPIEAAYINGIKPGAVILVNLLRN